jgi:hypothetical protein
MFYVYLAVFISILNHLILEWHVQLRHDELCPRKRAWPQSMISGATAWRYVGSHGPGLHLSNLIKVWEA